MQCTALTSVTTIVLKLYMVLTAPRHGHRDGGAREAARAAVVNLCAERQKKNAYLVAKIQRKDTVTSAPPMEGPTQ